MGWRAAESASTLLRTSSGGTSALPLSFMIALVTGSSGFIGSHLVDALIARGATVRVLARAGAAAGPLDPRITRWTVDLLDDRSVRESPAWTDVTHVFHLAGVTKRRTLHPDPRRAAREPLLDRSRCRPGGRTAARGRPGRCRRTHLLRRERRAGELAGALRGDLGCRGSRPRIRHPASAVSRHGGGL